MDFVKGVMNESIEKMKSAKEANQVDERSSQLTKGSNKVEFHWRQQSAKPNETAFVANKSSRTSGLGRTGSVDDVSFKNRASASVHSATRDNFKDRHTSISSVSEFKPK